MHAFKMNINKEWFLFQCGVQSTCKFFKDYLLYLLNGLVNFFVFEKFSCAYLHQITLEIV